MAVLKMSSLKTTYTASWKHPSKCDVRRLRKHDLEITQIPSLSTTELHALKNLWTGIYNVMNSECAQQRRKSTNVDESNRFAHDF